jgi:hypothetical protein
MFIPLAPSAPPASLWEAADEQTLLARTCPGAATQAKVTVQQQKTYSSSSSSPELTFSSSGEAASSSTDGIAVMNLPYVTKRATIHGP